MLASGSVDSTVKVWDISKETCVHTAGHHSGPVKKVEWNSIDKSVMLAASEDRKISVLDSRFPEDYITHKSDHNIERYLNIHSVQLGIPINNHKSHIPLTTAYYSSMMSAKAIN